VTHTDSVSPTEGIAMANGNSLAAANYVVVLMLAGITA
jgi:hypothetical protein